jgi:hypothetical protein
MSQARQIPSPSPAKNLDGLLHNDTCPQCERMLNELNDAFYAVHHFVIRNYENRTQDENYLGELGRLIHAQVAARQSLLRHQRDH